MIKAFFSLCLFVAYANALSRIHWFNIPTADNGLVWKTGTNAQPIICWEHTIRSDPENWKLSLSHPFSLWSKSIKPSRFSPFRLEDLENEDKSEFVNNIDFFNSKDRFGFARCYMATFLIPQKLKTRHFYKLKLKRDWIPSLIFKRNYDESPRFTIIHQDAAEQKSTDANLVDKNLKRATSLTQKQCENLKNACRASRSKVTEVCSNFYSQCHDWYNATFHKKKIPTRSVPQTEIFKTESDEMAEESAQELAGKAVVPAVVASAFANVAASADVLDEPEEIRNSRLSAVDDELDSPKVFYGPHREFSFPTPSQYEAENVSTMLKSLTSMQSTDSEKKSLTSLQSTDSEDEAEILNRDLDQKGDSSEEVDEVSLAAPLEDEQWPSSARSRQSARATPADEEDFAAVPAGLEGDFEHESVQEELIPDAAQDDDQLAPVQDGTWTSKPVDAEAIFDEEAIQIDSDQLKLNPQDDQVLDADFDNFDAAVEQDASQPEQDDEVPDVDTFDWEANNLDTTVEQEPVDVTLVSEAPRLAPATPRMEVEVDEPLVENGAADLSTLVDHEVLSRFEPTLRSPVQMQQEISLLEDDEPQLESHDLSTISSQGTEPEAPIQQIPSLRHPILTQGSSSAVDLPEDSTTNEIVKRIMELRDVSSQESDAEVAKEKVWESPSFPGALMASDAKESEMVPKEPAVLGSQVAEKKPKAAPNVVQMFKRFTGGNGGDSDSE